MANRQNRVQRSTGCLRISVKECRFCFSIMWWKSSAEISAFLWNQTWGIRSQQILKLCSILVPIFLCFIASTSCISNIPLQLLYAFLTITQGLNTNDTLLYKLRIQCKFQSNIVTCTAKGWGCNFILFFLYFHYSTHYFFFPFALFLVF